MESTLYLYILFFINAAKGFNQTPKLFTDKTSVRVGDKVTVTCRATYLWDSLQFHVGELHGIPVLFYRKGAKCQNLANDDQRYESSCNLNTLTFSLLIKNVSLDYQNKKVWCQIKNNNPDESETYDFTNFTTIVVEVPLENVFLSINDRVINSRKGELITLECCTSPFSSDVNIYLQWTKYPYNILVSSEANITYKEAKSERNLIKKSSRIQFIVRELDHRSIVYCSAVDSMDLEENSTVMKMSKHVTINIISPGVDVLMSQNGSYMVDEGDTFKIPCLVSEIALTLNTSFQHGIHELKEHTVHNASCYNSGIYTCIAGGSNGNRYGLQVKANVTCSPIIIAYTDMKEKRTIQFGENLEIIVQFVAYPAPTSTWFLRKSSGLIKELAYNDSGYDLTITSLENFHTSTLVKDNFQLSDTGEYIVIIENTLGLKNMTFSIEGKEKASLIKNILVIFIVLLVLSLIVAVFIPILRKIKHKYHGTGQENTLNLDAPESIDTNCHEGTIPISKTNVELNTGPPAASECGFEGPSKNTNEDDEMQSNVTKIPPESPNIEEDSFSKNHTKELNQLQLKITSKKTDDNYTAEMINSNGLQSMSRISMTSRMKALYKPGSSKGKYLKNPVYSSDKDLNQRKSDSRSADGRNIYIAEKGEIAIETDIPLRCYSQTEIGDNEQRPSNFIIPNRYDECSSLMRIKDKKSREPLLNQLTISDTREQMFVKHNSREKSTEHLHITIDTFSDDIYNRNNRFESKCNDSKTTITTAQRDKKLNQNNDPNYQVERDTRLLSKASNTTHDVPRKPESTDSEVVLDSSKRKSAKYIKSVQDQMNYSLIKPVEKNSRHVVHSDKVEDKSIANFAKGKELRDCYHSEFKSGLSSQSMHDDNVHVRSTTKKTKLHTDKLSQMQNILMKTDGSVLINQEEFVDIHSNEIKGACRFYQTRDVAVQKDLDSDDNGDFIETDEDDEADDGDI